MMVLLTGPHLQMRWQRYDGVLLGIHMTFLAWVIWTATCIHETLGRLGWRVRRLLVVLLGVNVA